MIINIQIRRWFDQDIMQIYVSIIDQQGKKVVHWIYFLDWYDAKIISHWQKTKKKRSWCEDDGAYGNLACP